jgi:hypothetical protein
MSLVLDSSETLNWYFEDERTPATVALRRQVAEKRGNGSRTVPTGGARKRSAGNDLPSAAINGQNCGRRHTKRGHS